MKEVFVLAGEFYAMLAIALFSTGHWIGGIAAIIGALGQWLRIKSRPF